MDVAVLTKVYDLEKTIAQMNKELKAQTEKIDEMNRNIEEMSILLESIKKEGLSFKPGVYLN